MPTLRSSLALFVGLPLAACAIPSGHDFTRADPAAIVLGQTTPAELIGYYGKPSAESEFNRRTPTIIFNDAFHGNYAAGDYAIYRYTYSSIMILPITLHYNKAAIFSFWNGKLVGYDYSSDFANDSTDFPTDKARAALGTGGVTQPGLTALLGPPTGRFVFPLVPRPGEVRDAYHFLTVTGFAHPVVKGLDVIFAPDGRLVDYRFNERK